MLTFNLQLTPQILKPAVSKALIELTAPIRAAYEASKDWQDITLKAYPPPEKKVKKVKDKGSRHPGKPGGKPEDKKPEASAEGAAAGTKEVEEATSQVANVSL